MLEHAIYSVISPEGCAAILWKDRAYAPEAAESLKLDAAELLKLGIVDEVLPEPTGGAHRDWDGVAKTFKLRLKDEIDNLMKIEDLCAHRIEKYREIGKLWIDYGLPT